jgi:hypothetical protein
MGENVNQYLPVFAATLKRIVIKSHPSGTDIAQLAHHLKVGPQSDKQSVPFVVTPPFPPVRSVL